MSAPTVPIADPGDVLAEGPDGLWRWIAYRWPDGTTVAALYVAGRLLRRNHREWWVVDFYGRRQTIKGDPIARFGGTAPPGWLLHPEHVELARGGRRD